MSNSFKNNPVNVYFNNLRKYIDTNNVTGGVEFLIEIKTELLYLLLKNGQNIDNNKKLSKLFIQRCNDSINYCNLLEKRMILNESHNSCRNDPTYEQMVDYIKGVFGDDVDEFDLNGGIYYFASHYHNGQFSNLYRAISQTGYKPGVMSTEPVPFQDYEYTYLLYNIKYDVDSNDIDDDDDDDSDELPDSMRFVVKKSQVMQDGGAIDRDDLEGLMAEYISEVTGQLVKGYEFRLISSSIVEGENDTMNAVYRSLVNKFASVNFDVGGTHDDLPPGEHYDLPPGIKEQNTNMNKKTISIHEVKNLINEVIAETLQQEIGSIDYDDYEPIASKDDFAGDRLNDLTDTVNRLIKQVEDETGNYDKAYDRLVAIYKQLTDAIDNPRLSNKERKHLEHDYEGILGNIHRIIGGGGGGSEKMYVAEALSDKNKQLIIKWVNEMGSRKAAIRMIDSILKSKMGLGTDDLADTSTFADGVDSVEEALQQRDYAGAYETARDTAQSMIEDEGGDGLFECGSWEEAVKHPMFKEAVLTEKAPPGMEGWVKANKDRFKDQYGDKKGMSVLYATAWKMFYKNKSK